MIIFLRVYLSLNPESLEIRTRYWFHYFRYFIHFNITEVCELDFYGVQKLQQKLLNEWITEKTLTMF